MSFNIINGLKLAWAHIGDEQMFAGWLYFMLPGIFAFSISFYIAIGYIVMFNMFYVLIRCWDDPIKLGWCDE